MRCFTALVFVLRLAATVRSASDDYAIYWRENKWNLLPDPTAEWYKSVGAPLPDVASELNVVEHNKSYVVKLECLGCPFRVCTAGTPVETWQEPPQDNSLMLNFTVDQSEAILLLNGNPVFPLPTNPWPGVTALQVPTNTSVTNMEKMLSTHILDRSWMTWTKYGKFDLEFEHAVLGTEQPSETWLEFDVLDIHLRHDYGSHHIENASQKMVQLRLTHGVSIDREQLAIKDIQVVGRSQRRQPLKVFPWRNAVVRTHYNPLQWDEFGKFGTVKRSWTLFNYNFEEKIRAAVVVAVCVLGAACWIIFVYRLIGSRKGPRVTLQSEDATVDNPLRYYDAPPAYDESLMGYVDAPPAYSNRNQGPVRKED